MKKSVKGVINEGKGSEANLEIFKVITEQSPALIILTDKKAKIEYVNKKFTEVTGYTLDEAKGKNPKILKSGISTKEAYKNLWKTINEGNIWKGEFYNKKKNKDHYWASALIAPVKNKKGEITNFVGIQEDITRRKEYEEKLGEKIIELEKFQKFAVDRELRMISLKKEVNALLKKQKKAKKYKI